MNWATAIILITITIAIIAAWLLSEFKTEKIWIRCTLGILALTFGIGLAVLIFRDLLNLSNSLTKFNYNAHYGFASKQLIDTTVKKIESGETETVLKRLKKLQEKFRPTYENRASYNELVNEAVNDM
jgi:hypothetical protein